MNLTKGKVILIGSGPGDPELLTLKAVRWLKQADLVLADRLVSPAIIDEYVSPGALVLGVGKQCRKGASTPQASINEMMVSAALSGKLVVRLKGGDVSIFSNILDELQALSQAGIPYEIVPGITAALGAAAYAGIPLTARSHSNAVRFLTFYQTELLSDQYWRELAQTNDTLVFYMSGEMLPVLLQKLNRFRIDESKLLALVEQATTPHQQVHVYAINEAQKKLEAHTLASPSLIIIGKVVGLYSQFRWMENSMDASEYFPPVAARVLSCEEEQSQSLLTA